MAHFRPFDPRSAARPGRYSVIEVGSHTVLLLVASIDADGPLTPVIDDGWNTRLSEQFYETGRLSRPARERTLTAIVEAADVARQQTGAPPLIVGTSVTREATTGPHFAREVEAAAGEPLHILSGEQEAAFAFYGNLGDPRLPPLDNRLTVVDIGGGSTELVTSVGGELRATLSYPLGTVRLTEQHLKSDPPHLNEVRSAEAEAAATLADLEPLSGEPLLGCGGTLVNLARIALLGGLVSGESPHGATLTARQIGELYELFRSLPVKFRRRVPGLEPERADVIFAGIVILQQLFAQLSASNIVVTANGVRHGCLHALARGVFPPAP